METKAGINETKSPKTKRIWATVTSGGFAQGKSFKLAMGASQDIPVAEAENWKQHTLDLTTDLNNLLRVKLTPEGKSPKLINRVVQIIMPK